MANGAQYGLPTIRRKPFSPWELWFERTWAPLREVQGDEKYWEAVSQGRPEAVADFYAQLGAYTLPFLDPLSLRRMSAAVQTYAPGEIGEFARRAGQFLPLSRPFDNWRWQTSDIRWGAFLEGLRKARANIEEGIKKVREQKEQDGQGSEESPVPRRLPSLGETAVSWLERLAEWGLKYDIDPVDLNNRYLRNRWERQRAARDLESLMKAAPSEQVAQIGRAMVGDFSGMVGSSPIDEIFGYRRGVRGTPFAFRNRAFM